MRKYNYPDENGLEKTLKNIQYSASIFILLQGLQTFSVVTFSLQYLAKESAWSLLRINAAKHTLDLEDNRPPLSSLFQPLPEDFL